METFTYGFGLAGLINNKLKAWLFYYRILELQMVPRV